MRVVRIVSSSGSFVVETVPAIGSSELSCGIVEGRKKGAFLGTFGASFGLLRC